APPALPSFPTRRSSDLLIFLGIDSIVQHVVGAKWEPIVTLVRILIVAGFLRSIAALATGVFHGAGRPHLAFWMNLPRLVLLTVRSEEHTSELQSRENLV